MILENEKGRNCSCTPDDARAFPQIGEAWHSCYGTDLETTYTCKQCTVCGALWEHMRDTGAVGKNLKGYLRRLPGT